MNPHNIANYGGTYQNEEAVVDPTSEMDAAFGNRLLEDTAQMSRACGFTWFSFLTTTTAAPTTVAAADVAVSGFFGSGSAQKPTVAKTADGVYTLTWPSSFADALVGVTNMDSVAETQTVSFTFASGLNIDGLVNGTARVISFASNVLTVRVFDDAAPASLSDLSGGKKVSGYVR